MISSQRERVARTDRHAHTHVVEVEARSWHVEAEVAGDDCLGALGLEEARRLLLVDTEVAEEIAVDERAAREVALGAIGASALGLLRVGAITVAPQSDRRGAGVHEG